MTLSKLTIRELFNQGMALTDKFDKIDFTQSRNYKNRWWIYFFSEKGRTYAARLPYIEEMQKRFDKHNINAYTVKTYGPRASSRCMEFLDS